MGDGVRVPKHRRRMLARLGIPLAAYQALYAAQGGVCASCRRPEVSRNGKEKSMVLDRDLLTGAMRGLLCGKCSRFVRFLRERPEGPQQAAAYCAAHEHPST